MKLNSVRFKISILYTAVLGLILVIYSGFLYLSLHYTLYDDLDKELLNKAEEITVTINSYLDILGRDRRTLALSVKRTVNFDQRHIDISKIADIEKRWLLKADKLDIGEDIIRFTDAKGELIAALNSAGSFPDIALARNLRGIKRTGPVFKTVKLENRVLRIIYLPFDFGADKYMIQIGTSLKPVIQLLTSRIYVIAISIVVVLLLTSFTGGIFASRILKPVLEITRTARNLTHKDLSARVKTEHIDSEMRYLSDAFNDMLSRLEEAFRYIGEFSSNVAHELKTPLTIIRGESEVALRKERDTREYKRVIQVNMEESKRMLKIIDDLLLLGRMDHKREIFKFAIFDLTEPLSEICEQVKMLASEKNIFVCMDIPEGPIMINADSLHLRRLFFNIMDNARKFTPAGGRIGISVQAKDQNVLISISDTGIGIAKEDLPDIFKRFFHKDTSTGVTQPGTGLGLSIAQAIAKVHRGEIRVESAVNKGSTFILILPLK
ncbi:MAG: ATP-binding protein [Candidatus Omnitrophota bacterium]